MTWLIYFITGWFGSLWWPGRDVDAPPKGGGDPWWTRVAAGIIAGAAAIYVVGATGMSDPMPGIVLSIATGCVVGRIVMAIMGMMTGGARAA